MSLPETNRRPAPPLPHDAACKPFFAHALAVEHLMRGFASNLVEHGPVWFGTLDFDTLDPVPNENIDGPGAATSTTSRGGCGSAARPAPVNRIGCMCS